MLTAPFMTGKLTKEFIEKNGRSPTKDEFIAIQHEAVNTLINNNFVYGILGQGGTKMSENASKRIPTVGQVIDHTKDPVVIKPTEEQVVFLSRDIKAFLHLHFLVNVSILIAKTLWRNFQVRIQTLLQ